MSSIYFLSPQILALLEQLEESGGELTPELQAEMEAILEATPEALERAGFAMLHIDAKIEAATERINTLRATKAALEASKQRLREALLPVLEAAGGKFKGLEFTLSTTTRTSEAFVLAPGHNAFELDEKFYRIKEPELNLPELKAAQKAGQLPAEIDYAAMETTSITLRRAAKKADASTSTESAA